MEKSKVREPMEPEKAAADISAVLSKSTAQFIDKVGFDDHGKARTVTFQPSGENDTKTRSLEVPILAIVPIPNLQIDEVDILFDMEVKESRSSQTPKGLSGVLESFAGSIPTEAKAEVVRSPKAKEEKIRSLREELAGLEKKQAAAKETLERHFENLKDVAEEQRKTFQERLRQLMETAKSDAQRETYKSLIDKVNGGFDEFRDNVPGIVYTLCVLAQSDDEAVLECFRLDPNGSNVLFDMGDHQTADFYGKMVVAIRAQQSLNSIEQMQQEKREEYNRFLLEESK